MTTLDAVVEKVRELVAPFGVNERMEIIRTITQLEYVKANGDGSAPKSTANEDPFLVEQERWFSLPVTVRERFRGRFIAVQDGQVIDEDDDHQALIRRVHSHFPDGAIPILNGDWDETPVYTFNGFRTER